MRTGSGLVWDEWNTEHIKKHQVSREEVEQVYLSKAVERQTYLNRVLILGRTKKGRFLTIVAYRGEKGSYVISARDMSRKERRYYSEKTKAY